MMDKLFADIVVICHHEKRFTLAQNNLHLSGSAAKLD